MPIYAYRCLKCGAEPEFIQKFSDPPMAECEACGGELVRQMTAAAFHLKGGGWYKDGYASAKADGGGDKAGEAKAGDSKPAESKPAESKPAGETKSGGSDAGGSSSPPKAASA